MTIPIVFSFDKNLVFPASVCICSLLMSSSPETVYDVFILYGGDVIPRLENEDRIINAFPNVRIQYKSVGDSFSDAYQIRGITTPTYYRLLIPDIIYEYDKVIYADVDIIFRSDLSELYSSDLGNNLLGAVYALEKSLSDEGRRYTEQELSLTPGEYFQAGLLLMNLKIIREEGISKRFYDLVPNKYKFQDQDILNIVCQDRILSLPWYYNMGTTSFIALEDDTYHLSSQYANASEDFARNKSNIHYNGQKPWKDYCLNFDIWWEYYRKSPVFDAKRYFDFFYKKLNYLDYLSFSKRVKLLIRYFRFGQLK